MPKASTNESTSTGGLNLMIDTEPLLKTQTVTAAATEVCQPLEKISTDVLTISVA